MKIAGRAVSLLKSLRKIGLGGVILASLTSGVVGFGQDLDMRPLKVARSDLKLKPYTAAEKKLLAEQALLFIENLYVHRELKIKDFGIGIDPVPALKALVAQAESIPDEELHSRLQQIFLNLRDNHTNYSAPLPLACSYVISPLMFTDATENGKEVILFDRVVRLFQKIPGDHTKAKKLDQLVSVDGIAIDKYMEKVRADGAGANKDAGTVFGLMTMAIRNLASLPIPEKDTIKYTLKGEDGKTYDIESPYYAIVNESSCVESAKKEADGVRIGETKDMEHPTVRLYRKYVAPEMPRKFDDDPLEEIAKFIDIDTPAGKLTVVQLFTFMPEQASVESLIHRMRTELIKRQDASNGLIVDVRNNGGGAIKLSEEMLQLFTPSAIQPTEVRLLPNKLNLNMFLKSNGEQENAWTSDIRKGIASHTPYTTPRVLTTPHEANRSGQVWFKPVVVLTNGSCYSACDLFAAGMQDHGAATIIGTHAATGAGGANVMEYRSFRAVFGENVIDNPFKKLPGGQSMRVSWRQTVRVGKHAGELIEDAGIKPDIVVRSTKADLARGESFAVMKKIHETIDEMRPRFLAKTRLASSARMANGATAKWTEAVSGVDTVEVHLDGEVLETYHVATTGENLAIEVDHVRGNWESRRFELVGKIKNETAFRVVREIFWRGSDVAVTKAGIREDLSGQELKYFKTWTSAGGQDDGWQLEQNILRVGQGPKYASTVTTETFVPLDVSKLKGQVALAIKFNLQSEDTMDIFSIIARNADTGEEQYLYSFDGTFGVDQEVLVPMPRLGDKFEIVLEFESDENWNMAGPEITSLGVVKMQEDSPFKKFFSNLKDKLFPPKK
jgi:hypothetical protein